MTSPGPSPLSTSLFLLFTILSISHFFITTAAEATFASDTSINDSTHNYNSRVFESLVPKFSFQTLWENIDTEGQDITEDANIFKYLSNWQLVDVITKESSSTGRETSQHHPNAHFLNLNSQYLFFLDDTPSSHHVTIDLGTLPNIEFCTEFTPMELVDEENGLHLLYFFLRESSDDGDKHGCALFVWDEESSTASGKDSQIVNRDLEIWVRDVIQSSKHQKLWLLAEKRFTEGLGYLVVEANYRYVGRGNNKYNQVVKDPAIDSWLQFDSYLVPGNIWNEDDMNHYGMMLHRNNTWSMGLILYSTTSAEMQEGFHWKNGEELNIIGREEYLTDQGDASFETLPFIFLQQVDGTSHLYASNATDNQLVELHVFESHNVTQEEVKSSIFLNSATLLLQSTKNDASVVYKCSLDQGCVEFELQLPSSADGAVIHEAEFTWQFGQSNPSLTQEQLDSIQNIIVSHNDEISLYSILQEKAIPLVSSTQGDVSHEYLFSVGRSIFYRQYTNSESSYYFSRPTAESVEVVQLVDVVRDKIHVAPDAPLRILSVLPHVNRHSISLLVNTTQDVIMYQMGLSFVGGCMPSCNPYGTEKGICSLDSFSCVCKEGFSGESCRNCTTPGMIGEKCDYLCSENNCVHGICSQEEGICKCFEDSENGFWADSSVDEKHCTICLSSNFDAASNCTQCTEGWTHLSSTNKTCSVPLCFNIPANSPQSCAGHGRCTSPNYCDCMRSAYDIDIWTGIDCSEPTCFGYHNPEACHGNGVCVGYNQCECNESFEGADCEHFSDSNALSFPWILALAVGLGALQFVLVGGLILYLCGTHFGKWGNGHEAHLSPNQGFPARRPINVNDFTDGILLVDEESEDEPLPDTNSSVRESDTEETQAVPQQQPPVRPQPRVTADISREDDFGLHSDDSDEESGDLILV